MTDEAQAPVVASLRDLSLLTDLQLRILVSARHEDPRGEVRAWTAPADAVGVAAGSMRFDGPEAIEAVKLLLGAGHLRRDDVNTMSLTTFGRRLAELASESPSVAARLQGPARTPSRVPA